MIVVLKELTEYRGRAFLGGCKVKIEDGRWEIERREENGNLIVRLCDRELRLTVKARDYAAWEGSR